MKVNFQCSQWWKFPQHDIFISAIKAVLCRPALESTHDKRQDEYDIGGIWMIPWKEFKQSDLLPTLYALFPRELFVVLYGLFC